MGVPWPGGGGTGGVADLRIDEVIKTVSGDILLTDMQKIIRVNNDVSDIALTIQQDAAIEYPLNSWVEIYKTGSGEVSILRAGGGVSFEGIQGNVNFKIAGNTGNSVFLRQNATENWIVTGSVKAF